MWRVVITNSKALNLQSCQKVHRQSQILERCIFLSCLPLPAATYKLLELTQERKFKVTTYSYNMMHNEGKAWSSYYTQKGKLTTKKTLTSYIRTTLGCLISFIVEISRLICTGYNTNRVTVIIQFTRPKASNSKTEQSKQSKQ